MNKDKNLLGTLAMVLNDEVRSATNAVIGMSGETVSAIVLLGANPGLSVGQVAHALALTPSGAVRLADRLAGDGLIERQHGTDQRTVTLSLTAKGMESRLLALSERERIISKATDGIAEEDMFLLGILLDKMLTNLMTQADQNFRYCRMCDEDACEPDCPVERCWVKMGGFSIL
jgi:DNA-binding MarR family transcriptional regulator